MAFFDSVVGDFTSAFGVEPNNLPVIGGMFTNQNEKDLIRAMNAAAAKYGQAAPQHVQATTQNAQNRMQAFQPANNMLAAMGGPGAAIDFNKMFAPVFPEGSPGQTAPQAPGQAAGSGSSAAGLLTAAGPMGAPVAGLAKLFGW